LNAYIDQNRLMYGALPICKVLQVAPSAYRRHAARQRDPSQRSHRARRDDHLMAQRRIQPGVEPSVGSRQSAVVATAMTLSPKCSLNVAPI